MSLSPICFPKYKPGLKRHAMDSHGACATLHLVYGPLHNFMVLFSHLEQIVKEIDRLNDIYVPLAACSSNSTTMRHIFIKIFILAIVRAPSNDYYS